MPIVPHEIMRYFATIFCILILSDTTLTQELLKKTESLISLIESSNKLVLKSRCDTVAISHSNYFIALCDEVYLYNDRVFKIVNKVDRVPLGGPLNAYYGEEPQETGTIRMDVFYFDRDTLIKVFSKNHSNSSAAISSHYFSPGEIRRLKSIWERSNNEYCEIKNWFEKVERLLADFKQGKIN